MTVGKKVLELDNIDKTFGAVNALSGIQLSVLGGEVIALVGDNGAGKSTLVKIAAGVIPPDQGNILLMTSRWFFAVQWMQQELVLLSFIKISPFVTI